MIIQGFLDLIFNIFNTFTKFIDIPDLPTEVDSALSTAIGYLDDGFALLSNFMPLPYLTALFGIILAIDAGVAIYHFVMWIIKKIPMASIS